MKKFQIYKFDPVIYPRKIWVATGGERKDIADHFDDEDGDPYFLSESIKDSSHAITGSVSDRDTGDYGELVWLHSPADITIGIMAHEADHAANLIFKAIGANVDVTNDEPHAYLVGFITDCIEKVKKGKV